jgi:hypothetical protein
MPRRMTDVPTVFHSLLTQKKSFELKYFVHLDFSNSYRRDQKYATRETRSFVYAGALCTSLHECTSRFSPSARQAN